MKIKILPTCLQGNYRDSLGELSNTSYGGFEADRFNITFTFDHKKTIPKYYKWEFRLDYLPLHLESQHLYCLSFQPCKP